MHAQTARIDRNGAVAESAQIARLHGSSSAWGADDALIRLFGVDVRDTTLDTAARHIVARAIEGRRTSIAFLNAHCVNVMHRDPAYRAAVEAMDSIFADGIGMRIAAKAAGLSLKDNVNGTDLYPEICRHAARRGVGLFLLGARDGIAAAAGRRMQAEHAGLVVSGTHHGYIASPDLEARVIDDINRSGAQIVLVALGVPAQEIWIRANRHRITAAVVIGVGGLFDYYSGRIPRAPLALRKAGLEWAWRLAQEPRRLAGRYLVGNATFLARLGYELMASPASFRQRPAH